MIDLAATEYEYEGVPETVEAGRVSLKLDNEGEELHEMALLRKNDGTTQSWDELLELPEEEAMELVSFAGHAFAPPGETDYAVAELEAGDYLAVCFVPVGTTSEEEEVDGPPHFTEGMRTEFTVG